jgi:hypothetical protein
MKSSSIDGLDAACPETEFDPIMTPNGKEAVSTALPGG